VLLLVCLEIDCYVAAILMDLSKAFDCLPHDILLSKLAAYGLSSQSVKLLENYLTGRKQQIIWVGLHTIKIKPFN
jgi:hypothetical protein